MQASDRDIDVRNNMRLIQIAAEHYAAKHGGSTYPTAINDEFKTYLRGGVEGKVPAPVGLINPFNSKNEFPVLGTVTDPAAVRTGGRSSCRAGEVQYCPLANGKGYAVIGGAHDGRLLTDVYNPQQILVLTNLY